MKISTNRAIADVQLLFLLAVVKSCERTQSNDGRDAWRREDIINYLLVILLTRLISNDSQSKTNSDQYRVLAFFFIIFRGVINLIYTFCSCVMCTVLIGGGMPVDSNGAVGNGWNFYLPYQSTLFCAASSRGAWFEIRTRDYLRQHPHRIDRFPTHRIIAIISKSVFCCCFSSLYS